MMLDIMYKVPQNDKISEVIISKDVFNKKCEPTLVMKEQ
jgi:ATP-dependent protease Clp ATPase subunit